MRRRLSLRPAGYRLPKQVKSLTARVCAAARWHVCPGNVQIATPFTGGRAGGGWRDEPRCGIRSHL